MLVQNISAKNSFEMLLNDLKDETLFSFATDASNKGNIKS
jgi:hypothetical protein